MRYSAGFLLVGVSIAPLSGFAESEQAVFPCKSLVTVTAEESGQEVEFDAVLFPDDDPLREVQRLLTPWETRTQGEFFMGVFESQGGNLAVERFEWTKEGWKRNTKVTGHKVIMGSCFPGGIDGLAFVWPGENLMGSPGWALSPRPESQASNDVSTNP